VAQNPTPLRVDIIAAVRDEQDTLREFVSDVLALELDSRVELKILFVEDSSRDGTRETLRSLCRESGRVGFVSLERGYGQGPALVLGMARSRADALITMDVDGSHPARLIPEFVAAHLAGSEVVQAHRTSLVGRGLHRDIGSALLSRVGRWLTGVNMAEQNVHFRLISSRVGGQILANPGWWRFLRFPPRTVGSSGFLQVPFAGPPRRHGSSKYGVFRLARLSIDGIVSLMTAARFAVMLTALVVTGTVCAFSGFEFLAGGAFATGLGLVAARSALPRRELLDQMQIRESSEAGL
jgi:glycosyltransferase involved in cell wall biosynthesis